VILIYLFIYYLFFYFFIANELISDGLILKCNKFGHLPNTYNFYVVNTETNIYKPQINNPIAKNWKKVDIYRCDRESVLDGIFVCSWASDIPSGASIVEVSSPSIAGSLPYVVAIGMISQVMNVSKRKQAIVPINHLQVSKICCFSEPFFSKMATPHLGGSVVSP